MLRGLYDRCDSAVNRCVHCCDYVQVDRVTKADKVTVGCQVSMVYQGTTDRLADQEARDPMVPRVNLDRQDWTDCLVYRVPRDTEVSSDFCFGFLFILWNMCQLQYVEGSGTV